VADLRERGDVDGVIELAVAVGVSRCRTRGPLEASIGAVAL
jgi:hypothetical protein